MIWGAVRVTDNLMTVGSLIAVVLLVWRALSPLQSAFMILGRFDQIMDSLGQINRLMSMPTERRHITGNPHRFEGLVRIQNVGFRYPNDSNPALQGIMMEAKPGEIVAIVGQNGSGKTTLLKLLLGFYYPKQALLQSMALISVNLTLWCCVSLLLMYHSKINFFMGLSPKTYNFLRQRPLKNE